jgi:NAD(P)-dependent dehydrogenase (short-subunit alcohol dehydrogenase family)
MRTNPEAGARLMNAAFANRFGTPAEVAAICVYLLGDEAGFTNGANFCVDGGRTSAT